MEAAYIMAIVLFSVAVLICQAGRIHDETAGAMLLHEAVEKTRHERGLTEETAARFFQECMMLRMQFPFYGLELTWRGSRLDGRAAGGDWQREIQMTAFRPEAFLRQITLLEDRDEGNEH